MPVTISLISYTIGKRFIVKIGNNAPDEVMFTF